MSLRVVQSIEFHCVCCAVRVQYVWQLDVFDHLCSASSIVAVVNCQVFNAFIVNQKYFQPVKLPVTGLKNHRKFLKSNLHFVCFLVQSFFYPHPQNFWWQHNCFKVLSKFFVRRICSYCRNDPLRKAVFASGAAVAIICFLIQKAFSFLFAVCKKFLGQFLLESLFFQGHKSILGEPY